MLLGISCGKYPKAIHRRMDFQVSDRFRKNSFFRETCNAWRLKQNKYKIKIIHIYNIHDIWLKVHSMRRNYRPTGRHTCSMGSMEVAEAYPPHHPHEVEPNGMDSNRPNAHPRADGKRGGKEGPDTGTGQHGCRGAHRSI